MFKHESVLLEECIENLAIAPTGNYLDCTLGGAGHSAAIAERLTTGTLVAFDQDVAALDASRARLRPFTCNKILIKTNFRYLNQALDEHCVASLDGVLSDLGVSSHQLDTAQRGFSYMNDGPLDMRMDSSEGEFDATQLIATYSERQLTTILRDYGEERWAARIAAFICKERERVTITTTAHLVTVIKAAIPAAARRDGPHPAKRTFQALRIEVNSELVILKSAFEQALGRLNSGGRLCVITFHSLEDRITKRFMQLAAKGCVCPPSIPMCICGKQPLGKIVANITPSQNEIENNPRSRSARLRVIEKY